MQALDAKRVPMDLFGQEQARISREIAQGEQLLKRSTADFEATGRAIFQIVDLAENLHNSYTKGSTRVRRVINQAWFTDIEVDDVPEPSRAILTEHASGILARE
jgi:hypothetical protein